jgi:ABC-type spermidine/putrescine transport system permease subunit I
MDEARIGISYILLMFCVMPILAMLIGIKNPLDLRNIKKK